MIKRFGILSSIASGFYILIFLFVGVPFLRNLKWSWNVLVQDAGYLVFLCVLLAFAGVNGYCAYLFLKSKQIDSYKERGITPSLFVFCVTMAPLLFFGGYFFVNHIFFYVFLTLGTVLFVQCILPFRKRLGVFVLVVLFCVLSIGILNGFEVAYCSQKGDNVAKSAKTQFIPSNSYEKHVFPKTSTISVGLHTELQCEDSFNAVQAFKDFHFWTL